VSSSIAFRSFAGIWLASIVVLLLTDPQSAMLSVGGALFASLLAWFTYKLVRGPGPETQDVLRASGSPRQLTAQRIIVIGAACWVMLYGWVFGSLMAKGQWMRVPYLTHFLGSLYRTRTPLHDSAAPFFEFAIIVVLPGALLLLCGANHRQLGLTRPAPGTLRATAACIALAVIFAAIGMATHKITVAAFGWLLLHNFFSNGFAEEFFARGMVMSHLRARLTDDWALVVQACIFAAAHFGSTLPEASIHGNPLLALANNVALNAPMGLALGFMALRGRSLVQGTIIHMFLDTMTKTM
jgi:membrane protease YdiL (CAAX protease family)